MVQFSTERKTDTDLYRKLYNAGIYVMVAGSRYGAPSSPGVATTIYDPTKAVELASTPKDPDLAGVISSIETFRKQRQIGKGLQLLGMVAGFGGFALQQKYSKDAANATKPKAAKQVPAEVFMAATVSVALGFIIDFDAGKHLRFKH